MLRPTLLRCLIIAGLLGFATTSSMWAQTGSRTATTQKAVEKKFRGRLPNGYGKLGLDQKQRTTIYGIQEKYHTQIESLEQQLDELKLKQSEEIYAVLTPEQKTTLKAQQDKSKAPKTATTASNKAAAEE